jgi:uncharacterized glyoxalase superfamily protein PhnB
MATSGRVHRGARPRHASPATVGATVRISRHADDPDAVAAQAIAAGVHEMFLVANQSYGLRQGRVVDPFGRQWLTGRPV